MIIAPIRKYGKSIQIREKLRIAKELRREFEQEFQSKLLTFVSAALGVVAALFWQSAITSTIHTFIPVSGAWQYELLAAFLVTMMAVGVLFIISKAFKRGTMVQRK